MLTAITATKSTIDAKFDLRFGRAQSFCIYDTSSGQVDFFDNEFANVNGGAGTRAAEKMVELKVTKVISGDFGPKAKDLLNKFNIQMIVIQDDNNSIKDIIDKIKV